MGGYMSWKPNDLVLFQSVTLLEQKWKLSAVDWVLYFIMHMWFFQVPEAFEKLIDLAEMTLKHALEEEEKVSLEDVTNFEEVSRENSTQLDSALWSRI